MYVYIYIYVFDFILTSRFIFADFTYVFYEHNEIADRGTAHIVQFYTEEQYNTMFCIIFIYRTLYGEGDGICIGVLP